MPYGHGRGSAYGAFQAAAVCGSLAAVGSSAMQGPVVGRVADHKLVRFGAKRGGDEISDGRPGRPNGAVPYSLNSY